MLLRKSDDVDHPSFAIHIPGDGFRLYKLQKLAGTASTGQGGNALSQSSPKFQLVMKQRIEFVVSFVGHHYQFYYLNVN